MAHEEPAADGERPALATNPAEIGFAPLTPGRFRKELIREGTWVHPTQHFQLTVTRERMRRWVEKFRLLRERGIRIPVPFGHSYDPKDNAGFLEELSLEGNALFGVLAIPRAEDAGKLGATVKDVSISINPDFRDGEGRRYGEVIEHVALTTRPLVGGQSDFLPLQLPDGTQAEVWRFSPAHLRPRSGGKREEGAVATRPSGRADPAQTSGCPRSGRSPLPVPATPSNEGDRASAAPVTQQAEASHEAHAARDAQGSHAADAAPGRRAAPQAPARSEAPPRSGAPLPSEAPPPAERLSAERLAFARELAHLRQSALERELTELLRAGRLTPAMREPARRLLALEGPVSLQLATGEARLDIAAEVRALLASIPEHALIDLRRRTVAENPRPVGEMTEERAAQLAEENRRLAHLEGRGGEGGSGASAT
jgi:hypothetical protein